MNGWYVWIFVVLLWEWAWRETAALPAYSGVLAACVGPLVGLSLAHCFAIQAFRLIVKEYITNREWFVWTSVVVFMSALAVAQFDLDETVGLLPRRAELARPLVIGLCLSAFPMVWQVCTRGYLPRIDGVDLKDSVVIVTGSNSGIGVETAREMARRNATVVMACRTLDTAYEVRADIMADTGNEKIDVMELDLDSFASVRRFVEAFQQKYTRLDILINNAGVMNPKRSVSKDGHETMLQSNLLAPLLLTIRLLPLMIQTSKTLGEVRVVNVSSSTSRLSKRFDFHDVQALAYYNIFFTYSRSKIGQNLWTVELARRLEQAGHTGVTLNSVMPGSMKTRITRNYYNWLAQGHGLIAFWMHKFPANGAYSTIHAALAPEMMGVTGKMVEHCNLVEHTAAEKDAKHSVEVFDWACDVLGEKVAFSG